MQLVAPGHTRGFRFVDLIRPHHRRVRECRGVGNESLEKLAGVAHRHRIGHHALRCLQVLFRGQPRPGVKQLAMHDRALQNHRTGADIVNPAIVIEGEHARRDQHELVTARRQVKMEIGGAGIGQVNRQVCRDLVEEEGFVVGMKTFVGAIVQRLRPIRRLVHCIPVAIDRHEIPGVQAEGIAVRAGEAGRFGIDRGMHVHDTLQSEYFARPGEASKFSAAPRRRVHSFMVLCEIRASRVAPRQKSIATAADALKPLDRYRNSSWRFFAARFAGLATPAVQRPRMAAY